MRRLADRTIREQFAMEAARGQVSLAVIDLGEPRHAAMRRQLALPFSTAGLVRYRNGRQDEVRMLTREVWRLYADEAAYGDMLARNIRALEAAIRRDPANWFWVHNRWKLPKPAAVDLRPLGG